MKKNQVNAILINQTKRRNTVLTFACMIIVLFVISISFFLIYIERNKKQYVSYDETSNIDYKVYLNDNEFFDSNYLDTNKQYIASLINYITADFNYNLTLEEKEVEYKYSYRIEANVDVREKGTSYSLYNKTEELKGETQQTTSQKNVSINETIKIDYNQYNNLIKKFINTYNLKETESILTINMYIKVIGSCEDFEENAKQESVITLAIPLTTKTMSIDLSNDLINTENNVMQCKSVYKYNYIFLFIGVIFALIDLTLVVIVIRYIFKTRTAENIYERELKKILNNYSSYIQTLDSEFTFTNYQLLKVNTFTDMLEIRDTIRQPILMKENKKRNSVYFVIPSNTKILYVYRLKVSDIEKRDSKKMIKF